MKNKLHMKHTLLMTVWSLILPYNASAQEFGLEPISDLGGVYRLAGICFLPDCEGNSELPPGIDINTNYCENHGFKYEASGKCPPYQYQETCVSDANYIKCDPVKWCKENGYEKTSCVAPEYLNVQCPNGLEFYKECKIDPKEACKLENPEYVEKCQNGWRLDDEKLCTYSPTMGICCNECEGFEFTASEIPQGYIAGERCEGCDGIRYKKEINPCVGFSECGEMGPATGSDVCWSGNRRLYKTCNSCNYTLTDSDCRISQCKDPDYSDTCSKNGIIYFKQCKSLSFCGYDQYCGRDEFAMCLCYNEYDCSSHPSNHIIGGVGAACESYGKYYSSCRCENGYYWKDGSCNKECTYTTTFETMRTTCTANCLYLSEDYCYRDSEKYFSGCGSSKCGKGEVCLNGGTCKCGSEYKYVCMGAGYIGGVGEGCKDGSYQRYASCTCQPGYRWRGGVCVKDKGPCCDNLGGGCGNHDQCVTKYGFPSCSTVSIACTSTGGRASFGGCTPTGFDSDGNFGYVAYYDCTP